MADEEKQDPFAHTRMSLGEHIEELRKRLVRGVAALLVAFVLSWFFYEELSKVVLRPMDFALQRIRAQQVEKYERLLAESPGQARSTYFLSDDPALKELRPDLTVSSRPAATAFGEGFWFALKISLYCGVFFGAPVLLWQLWQFVAAGLYTHERRWIVWTFPLSFLLFLSGVLFGYFVMVPWGLFFLAVVFPPEQVTLIPTLSEYLSLLTTLTLSLGAVFQLPLLMHVLVRVGLVQRETFAKYRRHFIVAIFVLAAVLTPPDPYTQTMLAVPMLLLYEIGLFSTRGLRAEGPRRSRGGGGGASG